MINKFEFIVYVWISVSLYRLHLDWCQFISSTFGWCQSISSTFGLVSVYIWCQLIQSTFGVVSVCSVYFCIGVSYIIYDWICVSLYRLHLEWCQFISYMFYLCQFISSTCWGGVSLYHLRVGVVSVYIIYVWNSVSLYRLHLEWCQFISYMFFLCQSISSTFGIV